VASLQAREIIHAFIKSKLADDTSLIITDEWKAYQGVADKDTLHANSQSLSKEYVQGIVHTNTLESVWSLFKRSVIGSYHQISIKHIESLS